MSPVLASSAFKKEIDRSHFRFNLRLAAPACIRFLDFVRLRTIQFFGPALLLRHGEISGMKKTINYVLVLISIVIGIALISFGAVYLSVSGHYSMAKTVEQDPSLPHVEIKGYKFHAEAFGKKSIRLLSYCTGDRAMIIAISCRSRPWRTNTTSSFTTSAVRDSRPGFGFYTAFFQELDQIAPCNGTG